MKLLRGLFVVVCALGCSKGQSPVVDAGDAGNAGASDAGDGGASDAGDAGASDAGSDAGIDPWTIDPTGYDGLQGETLALLANPCAIDASASTLTLSVRGGETGYVSVRVSDGMVIANGQTASTAECAVPATYAIIITEDAANPGVERAFLDYRNGTFALGAATPGITVALGAGSSLVVRGSIGPDRIRLGSTYATSVLDHSFVNVDDDGAPDVRFDGVTAVTITTGLGDDIVSANGGNGTSGVSLDATITLASYGGAGPDTLTGGSGQSVLSGGDGADLFVETATIAAEIIFGGKGVDTVDYGVRAAAVNVTSCTSCAADPACGTCIGDDGAAGEGDTIHGDVEIVLGGTAADVLSARWAACSDGGVSPTIGCTLSGGNGNDVLEGSAYSDTLIGGAGFDTLTYAGRTNAIAVSLDAAQPWVAGQNGEPGENDAVASDIENLTGGAGNDFLRGRASANIIHGGGGNDTIEGVAGNDALYGDANDDAIYGGAGNDMLVGGAGADALFGGDGDDFLDSTDNPASADAAIDCDGVNDAASTAGSAAGTADALVKDGSDTGALDCEL